MPPGTRKSAYPNYDDVINRVAAEEGVDPEDIRALAHIESRGNPTATSPSGAMGIMQVMPSTARSMGFDPTQLHDPETSIRAGSRYWKQMLDAQRGDKRLAAASYNAGPGAVAKYGDVPPFPETQDYVRRFIERRTGMPLPNISASLGQGINFMPAYDASTWQFHNNSPANLNTGWPDNAYAGSVPEAQPFDPDAGQNPDYSGVLNRPPMPMPRSSRLPTSALLRTVDSPDFSLSQLPSAPPPKSFMTTLRERAAAANPYPQYTMNDMWGEFDQRFPATPDESPPTALQRGLAAAGDIFQGAGQIYQGAHPRSVSFPVQPQHFAARQQQKYEADKQRVAAENRNRALIGTQMTPSMYDRANAPHAEFEQSRRRAEELGAGIEGRNQVAATRGPSGRSGALQKIYEDQLDNLIDGYSAAAPSEQDSYLQDIYDLGGVAGYNEDNIVARIRAGIASAPTRAANRSLTESKTAVNTGKADTSRLLNYALSNNLFTNRTEASAAVQRAFDTAAKEIDNDITAIGAPDRAERIERRATEIITQAAAQSGAAPESTTPESQEDADFKMFMKLAFPTGAQ